MFILYASNTNTTRTMFMAKDAGNDDAELQGAP